MQEATPHAEFTGQPLPLEPAPDHVHDHTHRHHAECGHRAILHNDHEDYIHTGHLHHEDGDGWVECCLQVTQDNPDQCTPQHTCLEHVKKHAHGPGCGHEAVPHGDHIDYLVGDHLHHHHGNHCDDHGMVTVF